MNDFVKILPKCHKKGVTDHLEYLQGVANLRADALSKGRDVQDLGLVNPQFQPNLSDREHLGNTLRVEWPKGQRDAFPPPNLVQLVLGRLAKSGHPDHGHSLLVIPELVSRNNAVCY